MKSLLTLSENKKCRRWVINVLKSRGFYKIDGKNISSTSKKKLYPKYEELFSIHPEIQYAKMRQNKIKESDKGFVYVIGSLTKNICKIGFSKNPERRISEIQTSCPHPLELILSFEGDMRTEKRLHRKYIQYKTHGEWFTIRGRLELAIQQKLSEKKNLVVQA